MAASNPTTISDLVFPFTDYVLALPGWYPTWLDPMPGDFNQRHIIAASLQTPQIVLYIGKDHTGTLRKVDARYCQLTAKVLEICVVYPKNNFELLDSVQSQVIFLKLLFKYAALIKSRWGLPKLLHSYIAIRGGLAAWLLAKKWNLPFVLTENWTIYYVEDPGFLPNRNPIFRWAVKQVYKNVAHFLPVTQNLNQRVQQLVTPVPSTVVPNVVQTAIFHYEERKKDEVFRFVHVSVMTYQKNPEGLLRGFKAFHQLHPQAGLLMVGPYPAGVHAYALELGLTANIVQFTGAVAYTKVAEYLHTGDCLILFSRYENLPCVILEALCCGMPVISTAVGGIAEVINENNGILVESQNEEEFARALAKLYTTYKEYDAKKIAESAYALFSYEAVGNQINNVYRQLTL